MAEEKKEKVERSSNAKQPNPKGLAGRAHQGTERLDMRVPLDTHMRAPERTAKTPELSFLLIVLAGVALVAVLLTIYFTGVKPAPGQADGPGAAMLATPQAKLLFDSFGKMGKMGDYEMEYEEKSLGLPAKIFLAKNGSAKFVSVKTAVDEREFYSDGSGQYACEEYGGRKNCTLVNSSLLLSNFAKGQEARFFDEASTARERDRAEFLIRKGAINFTGGVVEKVVGGSACRQIEYATDYRRLTLEELAVVGIPSDSPIVIQFSDFRWKWCFAESGVPIAYEMSYKRAGQTYLSGYVASRFVEGENSGFEHPKTLSAEAGVDAMFSTVLSRLDGYIECEKWISAKDKDLCYSGKAISNNDEKYCAPIRDAAKKDRCYISLVGKAGGADGMCEFVSGLKDDCYGQAAFVSGNSSFCDRIANETMRAGCTESFAPECATDPDCAIGGCSGTLCVKKGDAPGIVSACEFRDEYACYGKFGGCGCVEGKCAWNGGALLQECIANSTTSANRSSG